MFQLSIFMKDIFDLLTEQEGEGILKPLLREPDLQKLLQNPFHISDSNIKVTFNLNLILISLQIYLFLHHSYECVIHDTDKSIGYQ